MIRINDAQFAAMAANLDTSSTSWNDWRNFADQLLLFREGGRKIKTPWLEQFFQVRALRSGEAQFIFVDLAFTGLIYVVAGADFELLINDEFAHPIRHPGAHLVFVNPTKIEITFPESGGTLFFATDDKK